MYEVDSDNVILFPLRWFVSELIPTVIFFSESYSKVNILKTIMKNELKEHVFVHWLPTPVHFHKEKRFCSFVFSGSTVTVTFSTFPTRPLITRLQLHSKKKSVRFSTCIKGK